MQSNLLSMSITKYESFGNKASYLYTCRRIVANKIYTIAKFFDTYEECVAHGIDDLEDSLLEGYR